MNYYSTRDTEKKTPFSSAHAIIKGLAPDGGLFMPERIPSVTKEDILNLCNKTYAERAACILSKYLEDFTYEELLEDCQKAYSFEKFGPDPAKTVKIREGLYTLELWHGPTAAFKDMALQIMPRLLCRALAKEKETMHPLILVATSGDTGKAALEGYRDLDGISIMVFYPVDGVSRVQKLQMATQEGGNVNVCAIRGNFDDAQTGVKNIFADPAFSLLLKKRNVFLSSANSINWGRLAPQIVYYISAYCDLLNQKALSFGDPMDITVPTGNFGNIFAAYLAKRMGVPIGRLVCASNLNHVLTDFIRTGVYDRNRAFHTTMSPSMDILISSNLERLLYLIAGSERTCGYMQQLKAEGRYQVEPDILARIQTEFTACYATEEDTSRVIHDFFEKEGYLSDTHTAVALHAACEFRQEKPQATCMLVASTASPYKFAADVYHSLFPDEGKPESLSALSLLSRRTNTEITYPLRNLDKKPIRFKSDIDCSDMEDEIARFTERLS